MALLMSAFPHLTALDIESAIMRSAADSWSDTIDGPDNNYGYGLLDTLGAYISLLDSPVAEVSLNAAPPLRQAKGLPVVFTAGAKGGNGAYEYQFSRLSNGRWSIVQPYSENSRWIWDTRGARPGKYSIRVKARTAGSTAGAEASSRTRYLIEAPPPTTATLNATPPRRQAKGLPVVFTAGAKGGNGAYEYRFSRLSNGRWSIVQPYSKNSRWIWDTRGVRPVRHSVRVEVRSPGSTKRKEAVAFRQYRLTR
jgi:hypothetical protein